ncbi:MAG: SGNH/GDSL hydrolase family protein [Candidatus Latescibacteria bacterium]|nr:SGNH/GDSL hydrolase family protein [Candidatus Latescibacterota bacterium]
MTQTQPAFFQRLDEVRLLLKSDQPRKWVFTGDSITHGALHTFGWRDYVELFGERVRFELGRVMDLVVNSAISGHTTRDLLTGFDWRIGQLRPDAVLIMIGMNDCSEGRGISCDEFAGNLRQLASRIRDLGAIPVLQTTCPILPGQAPDRTPHFPAYMDAIRAVAADQGLPLIDHEAFWRQRAGSHFYWMSDAFHPNECGHRAFAFCLYEALGIFDPASHSCRLHLP